MASLAEQDGRIESSETVLLNPHGGDLSGFTLARGSEAQIAAVRGEDAFERLITRAALIVHNVCRSAGRRYQRARVNGVREC